MTDSLRSRRKTVVITPEFLSHTLGRLLDGESILVDEIVTNTPAVLQPYLPTEPGSYYSYSSGGLGWGLSAAAGIQLARSNETDVGLLGDGSLMLGDPVVALQLVQAYDLLNLWVIFNNRGWQAVGDAIADQYDDMDFETRPFTQFDGGTEYADLATRLVHHCEQESDPAGLGEPLARALEAVDGWTHAFVAVRVGEHA
ncbi:MAG: thiamine pyrophosphate-dependent enzyme [Natronomonas sp.]